MKRRTPGFEPRTEAARALLLVDGGADADETARAVLEGHSSADPRNRALFYELVMGTLRMRGSLDAVISAAAGRRVDGIEPKPLQALRIAAYQMRFLDRIPDHASVNAAVESVRTLGAGRSAGFVNAVLRKICAAPKGPLPPALPGPDAEDAEIEAALSHPAWMFRMFSEILGHEEAVSLCLANNLRPPLAIRAAGGPPDRNGVSAILKAEGIETGPGYFAPQSLIASGGGLVPAKSPSFAAGLWTIQDEAAQVVSLILGPKPGETVLDACAAPGGKTAHIAELMDDSGSVIALDKSEKRLGQLRGAAERMGLRSITILAADASKKLPFPAGHFDRILLDAPCSSIGTVRRSPEIKWRLSPRDPGRLSGIQTALLCNLADYLKPGGVLVYSVCTVARDECEDVVGGFIGRRPEFGIEPPRTGHGRAFPVTERGTVRTWPHLHGADGFFIARMIKRHPRGDPPWSPPVRGSP